MKASFSSNKMNRKDIGLLKKRLDKVVKLVNVPGFIKDDPISIPHLFTNQKDIEIMGLLAATLAWGQRVTILNNCHKLIHLFDGAPHQFIMQHEPKDLKRFDSFVHRTFNDTDLLWFIYILRKQYQQYPSLETAFTKGIQPTDTHIGGGLVHFHQLFFADDEAPSRTKKHVSTPLRNSACKRLNMYLRWMVRSDTTGVDFGIWKNINPALLLCPLDVHVSRTARELGLINRKQDDWLTVIELTEQLKQLDAHDPIKYDFALYGMGVKKIPLPD
jgi:uncharacterized protein (TIGR02757 family)